jgi:putative transposase
MNIVELNIPRDLIHVFVLVPPKVSISSIAGTLISLHRAIRVVNRFRQLKNKPYWGTLGLDEEMIRKDIEYQEDEGDTSNKVDFPDRGRG